MNIYKYRDVSDNEVSLITETLQKPLNMYVYILCNCMTNMMILTSTLSIFHTFPATYHLALLMVCTIHSSLDMYNAVHTMRI